MNNMDVLQTLFWTCWAGLCLCVFLVHSAISSRRNVRILSSFTIFLTFAVMGLFFQQLGKGEIEASRQAIGTLVIVAGLLIIGAGVAYIRDARDGRSAA